MATTVHLIPADFGPVPRLLAEAGRIRVTARQSRYGVAMLRVETPRGRADVLPFHGQQIWDAVFDGRPLTMLSVVPEPRPTSNYLENYGAFFLHCGAATIGNPGRDDTHPLHGELPNAAYDDAWFALDATGFTLGGSVRLARAYSHDYTARPRLRLGVESTEFEMSLDIDNHSARTMALVYMAHVNFRPVTGGTLHDTVEDDRRDVLHRPRPGTPPVPLTSALDRSLPPPGGADPELLHLLRVRAGRDGWTAAAQLHPDGTADVVRWRPADLPHTTRWITRRLDEDACGFALPATSFPTGMTDILARGQTIAVAPGATWSTRLAFGLVPATGSAALLDHIRSVRAGLA